MGYYKKFNEINPGKLNIKINSALYTKRLTERQKSKVSKCIELYAGKGLLTSKYKEIFTEVITVDKADYDNVQYQMTAEEFIKTELKNHLDFLYIDFDDEGCPGKELRLFFEKIKGVKKEPFIISITGTSLNRLADHSYSKLRKYPSSDYYRYNKLLSRFMEDICEANGFTCTEIFNKRREQGTTVYASYKIEETGMQCKGTNGLS